MSKARVTIRSVAEACEVSVPTVSQILNGKGWYSEATRAKVLATAEQLGYRKNAYAQAVANGRFGAVALLLAAQHASSLLPAGMLAGIERAIGEREQILSLARLPDQTLTDAGYVPRILQQLSCDGLLILYNSKVPKRMVELVETHGLPAIWLNDQREQDAVRPDDRMAGRLAVEHLVAHGHRRIAYAALGWSKKRHATHYSGREREIGYLEAMQAAGLEPYIIGPDDGPGLEYAERFAYMREQFAAGRVPPAVIGYNGENAAVVVGTAIAAGLTLGRDISVVSIDDQNRLDIGLFVDLVRLPFQAMGRASVEMLMERLEHGGHCESRVLPVEVVPHGSVGPPPA
ncbi:MAG: LacI family DNA-binding transcriptional regulator [Planctomycetota bacterium]|jgi:DNA-binding LacI/PurR family transcriptional regulator|nr:LacI family DNA-binding transcriptional regulator [Planctomycetota bacterium]